ncbi:hypothetical protein M8818_002408 [Zalaria obscura]|uniref:Uncharacterized protein n=1 Tax=Zalaria obscura TaxID=2024903 RepID=A0ACC3SHP3_9PEZI
MYQFSSLFALAAFVASVQSHGVILKAVGDSGFSQGFLGKIILLSEHYHIINTHMFPVDSALARNCTTISPCQQDATIIRDAEISLNIVNGCGRTELAGNIDIGEQTEDELAKNRVTKVTAGSTLSVTVHQVNADGAGPYVCDLDQSSGYTPPQHFVTPPLTPSAGNANTDFVPLTVTNNVPGVNGLSQAKEQDFTIKVALPSDLNCVGASTGNICTVRCRNNALAGPFGGCFAIQQSDGNGRTNSSAAAVDTHASLKAVEAQILVNKAGLSDAIAANQAAGAAGSDPNVAAISALNTVTATASGFATSVNSADNAATATSSAASDSNNGGHHHHHNNNKAKRSHPKQLA